MKTKKQIINETVRYYSKHPRGLEVNAIGCSYLTKEGNMCAVGRCMTKKSLKIQKIIGVGDSDDLFTLVGEPDKILKKPYHGHPKYFWKELQDFHDDSKYWIQNNKGGNNLTDRGLQAYKLLLINHAN
jgi:hypothetical protein